jgi:hypothetical protein
MLVQKDGKWTFVSRKTRRPLAYYRGEGKPSDEWVAKQERRVQYFKHMGESANIKPDILPKSGAGQDGTDELVKTYMKDTPGQSYKRFKDYIK